MSQLAFYTFGILKREEEMETDFSELQSQIPVVFEDAVAASGYIAPILNMDGSTIRPRFFDPTQHGEALITFSIWQDIESVFAFSYRGRHAQALRQRHDWFLRGDWPGYTAWWITDGAIPSFAEGAKRLEYLYDHGPSPQAFTFQQAYDPTGKPYELGAGIGDW